MKIFLNEITEQEKNLSFDEKESWVIDSIGKVDETSDDKKTKEMKKRPAQISYSIQKVDEVIVIKGKIKTHLNLICSRCANPIQFPCNISFSGLFCKDPVLAGISYLSKNSGNNLLEPHAQNYGLARQSRHHQDDDSTEAKDLDITYLSHEYIDLSEVLTEQLQLQVPFQPLCETACKGMCSFCGADLNRGRCACSKIKGNQPFSVLKDFKLN